MSACTDAVGLFSEPKGRIDTRQPRIGIIGLGYVGLPLALLYTEAKSRVTGFVFSCVLLVIGAYYLCPSAFAQISDSRTAEEPSKSWTATTESHRQNANDIRTIESHSRSGNRTLDVRSVQVRGVDGHFEPYQDIERETVQVDGSTVRTTTQTFARDVNKAKALVQITEEEERTLPTGESTTIRITSNPDGNGKLQVSERETVQSKRIAEHVEEIQTTVELLSINGGLAPAVKTREIRKRNADDAIQSEKATLLLDGGGKWQVNESRQTTSRREGDSRITEERISRLDAEGKLSEISRVVTKEPENSAGEKRNTVETYSIDVPGTTRDGNLHLVERVSTSSQSNASGTRTTEQRVEQLNAGDPAAGLRVSVLVNDRMVPGPSGEQSTVTIRARDLNGGFSIVSADTTKSDRIPPIYVQQTPPDQPK
jgi:hypothetical protein